ncbi:MAG: hypothetical protein QW112_00650 [Candidatus Micrarchaeia archaeon]
MKGQATIEYLVLVAVAIIIALVIFGFLGWIPGMAGTLRERQSKMYWASAYPIAIKDYKVTSTEATFLMENIGDDPVKLVNITVELTNGTIVTGNFTPAGYKLIQGEAKTYTVAEIECTPGSNYELSNVTIRYDVVKGISGQAEVGDRPIIGNCPS